MGLEGSVLDQIPDTQHAIVAAGGEPCAGVVEGDAIDQVRMLKVLGRLVGGDPEAAEQLVLAGGVELPIGAERGRCNALRVREGLDGVAEFLRRRLTGLIRDRPDDCIALANADQERCGGVEGEVGHWPARRECANEFPIANGVEVHAAIRAGGRQALPIL